MKCERGLWIGFAQGGPIRIGRVLVSVEDDGHCELIDYDGVAEFMDAVKARVRADGVEREHIYHGFHTPPDGDVEAYLLRQVVMIVNEYGVPAWEVHREFSKIPEYSAIIEKATE